MSPPEASILAAAIAATVALIVFIGNQFFQWHVQRKELRRVEYEKVLLAARTYLIDALTGDAHKSNESRAVLLTSDLLLKLNTPPANDERDVSFIVKHLSQRLLFLGSLATNTRGEYWGEQLERTIEVLGSVVSARHHNLLEPMDTFDIFMGLMEEGDENTYGTDEEGSGISRWWHHEPPEWLAPLTRTKRPFFVKRWWSTATRAFRRRFLLPRLTGEKAR